MSNPVSNQQTEKIFFKFYDFVNDLNEVFGEKMKSVKMYFVLINSLRTKYEESNEKYFEQIKKHVDVLTEFLVVNKDAIFTQKVENIFQKNLTFSERIFIDLELVLRHSDEQSAIWKHLLLLSSLVDPESRAKEVLKKVLEDDSPENRMIKNISKTLEDSNFAEKMQGMNPSNPMEMMSALSSSGMLGSIMNTMNGSSLQDVDPKKLINTMRGMLDAISSQIESQEM